VDLRPQTERSRQASTVANGPYVSDSIDKVFFALFIDAVGDIDEGETFDHDVRTCSLLTIILISQLASATVIAIRIVVWPCTDVLGDGRASLPKNTTRCSIQNLRHLCIKPSPIAGSRQTAALWRRSDRSMIGHRLSLPMLMSMVRRANVGSTVTLDSGGHPMCFV
jgi:hypothetical protein